TPISLMAASSIIVWRTWRPGQGPHVWTHGHNSAGENPASRLQFAALFVPPGAAAAHGGRLTSTIRHPLPSPPPPQLKPCAAAKLIYLPPRNRWRGSQVVRQGSAKALCVGSIPTLASNSKLLKSNELQNPEEASASESASEISTAVKLKYYPGITRQSLATTGFAARLV